MPKKKKEEEKAVMTEKKVVAEEKAAGAETAKTKAASKEAIIAKVTGCKLRIREEASTDSKVLGILNDGEEVEVLEAGDNWCKTQKGYLMRKHLTF